MDLNNDLITQFAKIATIKPKDKSATTVRGTIHVSEGRNYITIDGAAENSMTPVETTVELNEGDRVIAVVKDHSIVVTGNKTHPAIGTMTAGNLRSEIKQTADAINMTVSANYSDLDTRLGAEAQARSDGDSGLDKRITNTESTFTQRAESIESTVKTNYDTLDGKISNAESKITQTATDITSEVRAKFKTLDGNDEAFTKFVQDMNSFTFMGNGGTVKLTGGDINLTGAITWTDLDADTKNAIDTAGDEALEKAQEAYDKASSISIPSLPSYIKSAYIDGARIEAPTIIGGEIYAVGSKPEDENATFSTMDENGFYLYSNMAKADADNVIYPKISLYCDNNTEYINPMIVLGSGASDDHKFHNRFIIEKGGNYARLRYRLDYSGTSCGLKFNSNGTIDVEGNLSISAITTLQQSVNSLSNRLDSLSFSLPVGTILLSYSTSSPASYLAGSWERVSAAFIYMTNDNSKVGKTTIGDVVTAGGTASADYLCVAAWRRVS